MLFSAWTLLLVLVIGGVRGALVLQGKARPGDYTAGVPHGGDRYWRLNRAHSNCLEFLPLFAVVVLTGAVLGVGSEWLDRFAVILLCARVAQTLTHVASGSTLAINVRFSFFLVQVLSLIAMGVIVAGLA